MYRVHISDEMEKVDSFGKVDIKCSLKKFNLISKENPTTFWFRLLICVVGAFDLAGVAVLHGKNTSYETVYVNII